MSGGIPGDGPAPVPALVVDGLCKAFGGIVATDALSLELAAGSLHALIGPNGAGKSTTVAQIAGDLRPDKGRILLAGRDVTALPAHARARLGLGRSFQVTSVFPGFSARDNVALAVMAHQGHAYRFWRPALRDAALIDPAMALLERVGLAERAATPAAGLAHGERRALELAMALAEGPAVLLLDEPMAGMGPEESRRMVDLIAGLKAHCAILLVEHDMDAVFALADRVTVLVGGRAIASGLPDQVRADPEVRRAYLGDDGGAEAAPC